MHVVGGHSWFWSQERKGQNHLVSMMKEQTKGLRTHHKTVVLMKVERTDKKTFLRSSGRTLSCFLASLSISLLIVLATDSIIFISLHPGRAAMLASGMWSETTEWRQGQGGRSGFGPLTVPIRKGGPGCQSTGQVRGPNVALAAHPSPLAAGLPVAGPSTPW